MSEAETSREEKEEISLEATEQIGVCEKNTKREARNMSEQQAKNTEDKEEETTGNTVVIQETVAETAETNSAKVLPNFAKATRHASK